MNFQTVQHVELSIVSTYGGKKKEKDGSQHTPDQSDRHISQESCQTVAVIQFFMHHMCGKLIVNLFAWAVKRSA